MDIVERGVQVGQDEWSQINILTLTLVKTSSLSANNNATDITSFATSKRAKMKLILMNYNIILMNKPYAIPLEKTLRT